VSAALGLGPDGNVWVADVAGGRFAIFSADGEFLEFWGDDGADGEPFQFADSNQNPYGSIAFDADGSYYVLDIGRRTVFAFDRDRGSRTSWGGFGIKQGTFSHPVDIAVLPDGSVAVVDDERQVIEVFDRDGGVLRSIIPSGIEIAGTNALAVDGEGNLYLGVGNGGSASVRRYDAEGNQTGEFGADGPGSITSWPDQIAVDDAGRVFVTDGPGPTGDAVHVYDADGTSLGSWGPPGSGDGQLGFAWGIAPDGDGFAYVSEFGGDVSFPLTSRLQKFELNLPAP
jgi:sugar lactone lactonase YvrE